VAVNCVGPNYRYEVGVARAAIHAGVHLVDINDDYETTLEMFGLDAEARARGVVVVLGLGASPGVNNVLVRAAAHQLDEVEQVHTSWVMSAADPGGLALARHLIHSLSKRALTGRGGRLEEVESFVDGGEDVDFPPPLGRRRVFHVGHPEPITLLRAYPSARVVDDKATFQPASVNALIRDLGRLVREAPGPIACGGVRVDPMDFAAAYLRAACKALPGVTPEGGLRVEVVGTRRGRRRRVVFATAGRLGQGTGVPASIGAQMILQGLVTERGVRPPEECIDHEEFLYQLFERRNLAELRGWVEELTPDLSAA
jgi:saccharopine dehydrogenase (NAD+, L-lysine-forming)